LIARTIHKLSPRRGKPLIKVNCASIPKELFESEFFGHVKGAFTGAIRNRVGRFELADGGTLFLDEVCEIPIELQSKLLRVLEESEFERIGSETTRKVNVRIVAATNRDPREEVAKGRFREDLFFRLNVVPLSVPPLRERLDDVVLLAQHFLDLACRQFDRGPFELRKSHRTTLMKHGWPGNVRELRNVIDRAVALSTETLIELDGLLTSTSKKRRNGSHARILTEEEFRESEISNITAALEVVGWRIAGEGGAADLLGIPPSTLANRMRKFGISKPIDARFAIEESHVHRVE
jgi:transcriptional regulator with GAF, ATPase, and Fis domain